LRASTVSGGVWSKRTAHWFCEIKPKWK